jgi:hypothetical protein
MSNGLQAVPHRGNVTRYATIAGCKAAALVSIGVRGEENKVGGSGK